MTRIFITGATGFVGRYVAACLLARDDVTGPDALVRAKDCDHYLANLLDYCRDTDFGRNPPS